MGSASVAADAPHAPTVEDFFRPPFVYQAELSPDGRRLAVSAYASDGIRRLYVADLGKPFELRLIAGFSDANVRGIYWVNDRRLAYDAAAVKPGTQTGNGGLWAIDWDGSDPVQLVAANFNSNRAAAPTGTNILPPPHLLPTTYVFFSELPGDSDEVVVAYYVFRIGTVFRTSQLFNPDYVQLNRLNTRTGELHPMLEKELDSITEWRLDREGQPRIAVSVRDNVRKVQYREKGSTDWKILDQRTPYDPDAMYPVFIGYDDTLYAMRGLGDTVYQIDLKAPADPGKPILKLNGFDFRGAWAVDSKERRVLGVHFQTDAHGTRWLEPRMDEIQTAVDAALPTTVNTITCEKCLSARHLLVRSESDRQPPRYFLFDPTTRSVVGAVGGARPWIDPKQMGPRDFVRFQARDGRTIPAYFTLPPGRRKDQRVPLVVLVHGGPWVRGGSWEWDAEAQFLATRGYMVMQPEFRGSTGFGYEHFHAGWHQWGLAMQDDLADAARWAVARGFADEQHIAIGGTSYGGYATLMGLIKEPKLYRCGFELAGVTDIGLMYSIDWSDYSEEALKYGMPALVADPEKDAAQIRATSPLANAKRLQQPVLLAHGEDDIRVPLDHGVKFRDAVSRTNKDVQWVSYPDEGHGLHRSRDLIDYWSRVESLLARCLKDPSEEAPAAVPSTGGGAAASASDSTLPSR
jgi:dipeptidyl aminopeptidase/acylaminoacyl peptidase